MCRFSKLVMGMLTALLIAVLFSCSDLMGDVSSQGQAREAYVTLKLTKNNSRTILPVTDNNNFTDIVLMGAPSGEAQWVLGSWANVAELQSATIPVTPDYFWTFTLTARNGGIQFSGSMEKQITAGENALSFVLTISEFGVGTGSFSVTLDFAGAENAGKVSYAAATLEDFYSDATVTRENLYPSGSMVTFTSSGIAAGTYRAKVTFYATEDGTDIELATYREIVQIVTDLTSTATRTIQILEGEITVETARPKIKFDFSGAKAVAQLEGSASSSRAVATNLDSFVKILANGSMESVITVDDDVSLSNITAVYKSPVSDDMFVVFNGITTFDYNYEIGTYTSIGSLICVHSDGTIADILKTRDIGDYYKNYMSEPSLFTFDAFGNLYFTAYDYYEKGEWNNAGQVIYKFEPDSDALTKMVASVEGMYYSKLQITGDGTWLLAEGSRNNINFLRAIPANNPNSVVNIYYSSSWGSIGADKWVYDDNSGLVCFIARDGENMGLFTASKSDGFGKKEFRGMCVGGDPYDWFKDFYDGTINAAAFLTKFANACPWEIEFKYSYSESEWIESVYDEDGFFVEGGYYKEHYYSYEGIEALETIKEKEGQWILSDGYYDYAYNRLLSYCYLKDTNTCVANAFTKKNGSNYSYSSDFLNYYSITSLSAKSTGVYAEFWQQATDSLCVVQVIDENGTFAEKTRRVELPSSGKRLDSQRYDDMLFIKYALTDRNGSELGYQQIWSVDLGTGKYVNRFENVANRNNLEVISYNAGGDNLYFSAVRGASVENHVVDLITNQANPLGINRKMVAVYAF